MSIITRRVLQSSKRVTQRTTFVDKMQILHKTINNNPCIYRYMSGFSFAGPRNLNEILKTELIEGKNKAEISDIWMTYHENKERVHGGILSGKSGVKILERAEKS